MPSPGRSAAPRPSLAPQPSPQWSQRRSQRRRVLGAGVAAVLAGSLVACGGDDEPTTAPSTPPSSTAPASPATPSASESASATPSPSEPGTASATASPTTPPSETASAPAAGSLEDALLTAAEVPGLNAASSWSQAGTAAVGGRPFGWCSRTSALTIGAQEGVRRDFTSGSASAAQQVLDFVDETNARRAEQVFRGWHRDCEGARVRPVQTLAVPEGTAWWYLASRPGGGGTWEAFGLARDGARLTLLRMQHPGQDHSYAPGDDPLERALATAAGRLA